MSKTSLSPGHLTVGKKGKKGGGDRHGTSKKEGKRSAVLTVTSMYLRHWEKRGKGFRFNVLLFGKG